MRAAVLQAFSESLTEADVEVAEPSPDEVLVRILLEPRGDVVLERQLSDSFRRALSLTKGPANGVTQPARPA